MRTWLDKSWRPFVGRFLAPAHDAGRRLLLGGAAALLLGAGLSVAPPGARAAEVDDDWVGTWATSPQTQTNPNQVPRTFAPGTTVRQVVRISRGGTQLRIRVSNEYGSTPLMIGAATVARHQSGATIVAGTSRPVTFGGRTSVSVPAGAPMVSDPIALDAPPLSDLAISLYLPQGAEGRTFHNIAAQTNYLSFPGNYTDAVVMPVAASATNSWFLTGVSVKADDAAAAIVTLGDSITDGTRSTPNRNARWPNVLALRLQENPATRHLSVLNEGISGNRLLSQGSGPNTLSRLDRDVLAKPKVKYMTLLIGINDIGNFARGTGPAVTAEDVIAGYRQIIDRAHAHGIQVIAGTLTPIAGSGYDFPAAEALRQQVNQWIRSSGAFDAVVDFDAVTRDPAQPTRFLPAYDSGDHLHPNDAGYAAMGRAIPLSLFDD